MSDINLKTPLQTQQKQIKNLKTFSTTPERFEGSHVLCPGCAHSIIIREVLNATDDELVIASSTGCLEVCTAIYPHTSWDCSWIHIGFENGSTAIAGAQVAHDVLRKKGRIDKNKKIPKFLAFGGDGATYDIGFQWISGCFERGHDIMYVCLDNEVYANTGGQKSGSTPLGASATTSPAGSTSFGKQYKKKDIMSIFAAHNAPYVAQVAPNKWKDMIAKIQKGYATKGPVFINAMSPCTTEWRFPANKTIDIADLATDALVFPLFEIINNRKLNITYRPRKVIPIRDYLGAQQRFKHLFKKENEHIIKQFQADVDERWNYLQRREEAGV